MTLLLYCLALAPPASEVWPFDPPPLAELRAAERKVFAHYFPPFPVSIDNKPAAEDYYQRGFLKPDGEQGKHLGYGGYLRQRPLPRPPRDGDWKLADLEDEVRLASALGLDGFACDILQTDQGYLWPRTVQLLQACGEVDPGFRVMLMPDMMAGYRSQPDQVVPMMLKLAGSPAAFRLADGRLVLAPYNAHVQPPEWWAEQLKAFEAAGEQIAFVPLFQGWWNYIDQFAPLSYGVSDWGVRGPGAARSRAERAAQVKQQVGLWMQAVSPQDFRAKGYCYWETCGSLGFRTLWETAIDGPADWVQIVTWNDYSEASEISPSTGTQYAFYDLTAYYTTWFKTRRQPAIVRDVLYYFHRIQAHDTLPDPAQQSKPFKVMPGDPAVDQVELLAFLKEPGTLEIELAGEVHQQEAKAGITSFTIPLRPGTPAFRLKRGGEVVTAVESAFPIRDTVAIQDLLYRGGSSTRPPVPGVG